MELNKNNNIDKTGQLNLIFDDQEKAKEKVIEKDSKGRTLSDIIIESKTLSQKVIDSILYKDGEFYIEDMIADKWISINNELDERNSESYRKGEY